MCVSNAFVKVTNYELELKLYDIKALFVIALLPESCTHIQY